MKLIELKSWAEAPKGMQIYCPTYRDKETILIEKEVDFKQNWQPYGYKQMYLCRDIATVFVCL